MGVTRLRRGGDERGAVAVIVAIVMVVLVALAAFVVDLGNHWQTRRRLITSTDSAALAAARTFAYQEGDGCASATDFFATNDPRATITGCQVFDRFGQAINPANPPGMGYVKVEGVHDVKTGFGNVMGITSMRSRSASYAQWGTPRSMIGILPFGVCQFDKPYAEFEIDPNVIKTVTSFNPQAQSTECSNGKGWVAKGNWAVIAVGPGQNQIQGQLINDTVCKNGGFPYPMEVGDYVPGDVGNIYNSIDKALDCMVNAPRDQWYGMAVLDKADAKGFVVAGFVGLQVTKWWRVNNDLFLDLRYFRFPTGESPCCRFDGGGTTKVIRLCAVDAQDPKPCRGG